MVKHIFGWICKIRGSQWNKTKYH